MKQYIFSIGLSLIVGATVYGLSNEKDPYVLIEKQNRESVIQCLDSLSSTGTSLELQKEIEKCSKIPLRYITGTGKLAPASEPPSKSYKIVAEVNIKNYLDSIHNKLCQKQINSPLCNDRKLFDRLYQLTEERLPGKNFYPIMLGILNSESSLGTKFYPSVCGYTNNLAGKKWKKTDDNKSVRDQKIPDKNGCWLYSFESIEDFWISYTNTFKYGYPGCIDSKTPLSCIAPMYVKGDGKPKPQWVKNASFALD